MSLIALSHHAVSILTVPLPNPPAQAPAGAVAPTNLLIGIVKWGVLSVIALVAFIGVGAVAGGKIFSNHRSSHLGVQILMGDAVAVVLYGAVIGLLAAFA